MYQPPQLFGWRFLGLGHDSQAIPFGGGMSFRYSVRSIPFWAVVGATMAGDKVMTIYVQQVREPGGWEERGDAGSRGGARPVQSLRRRQTRATRLMWATLVYLAVAVFVVIAALAIIWTIRYQRRR